MQGSARQPPQGKLPILGLSAHGIVFGDIGTGAPGIA
jgi:KUP system potassium uptake protein